MYHAYACYVHPWNLMTQRHNIITTQLCYCGIIKTYFQPDFLPCNYEY